MLSRPTPPSWSELQASRHLAHQLPQPPARISPRSQPGKAGHHMAGPGPHPSRRQCTHPCHRPLLQAWAQAGRRAQARIWGRSVGNHRSSSRSSLALGRLARLLAPTSRCLPPGWTLGLAAAYEACSGTFEAYYMIDIETNGGTEQRLLELAAFCPRTGQSFSKLVQLPKDEWVSCCLQLPRGCLVGGGQPCLTRDVLCSSTGLWQILATICRSARSRTARLPRDWYGSLGPSLQLLS